MKWCLVGSMLVLGGAPQVSGVVSKAGSERSKEAVWLTDYAEARTLARRSGKPLLVVFR